MTRAVMHELTQFLAIATIHLLASASPGPDVFLVLRNSLASTRAGLFTVAGIVTGVMGQLVALLLGASLLFTPGSRALLALKLLGAAYLIYLGVRSLRATPSGASPRLEPATGLRSDAGLFLQGLLTNLTNPKAWLYWLSIGSQFVFGARPGYLVALVAISAAWFVGVALFVGTGPVRRRLGGGGRGLLEKGMGLLLLSYGVGVLWAST